jgi:hypothetical protein
MAYRSCTSAACHMSIMGSLVPLCTGIQAVQAYSKDDLSSTVYGKCECDNLDDLQATKLRRTVVHTELE